MAFPTPATEGQTTTQNGYTYIYRAALKMWVKQSAATSTGVSVSNGSVTTGNTSISNTGVTTGNTSITSNGVTTGNTSITSNGVTTGNTSVTSNGVTTGNTSVTSKGLTTGNTSVTSNGLTTGNTTVAPTGLTTGNTSVTANGVSVGNTAITPNGVTAGNTSLTANGLTTGSTSVTPNSVSVGNTSVTPNGVSVGNTSVTPNGITTGNTNLSPNGLTTGNTSVTPNGVSVGNTSVTPNGITTGNTSLSPNGLTTGSTSVTPNGVSVGNTSVTPNGITSGNTSLTPNGITSGNTSLTPNGITSGNTSLTPNGLTTGNTSVTPNGVSVGNTAVTPNGITTGNTSLTPNGLTTGNTSVTPNGISVGNVQITPNGIVGNASSASKLQNAVNIALDGHAVGLVAFDGSQSVTISTTLANTGVTQGTYTKVTVDGSGRVTNAANISSSDFAAALGYTPYNSNGGTISGNVAVTGNLSVQGTTTMPNGITVGNVQVTSSGVVGNASSASKLQNSVNIALQGDTSGSVSFDGSQSVTINTTLSNTGVAQGTYTKVTVDGTGRVSNGANLSTADLTSALGYTPYSSNGGTISGNASITGNLSVQGTASVPNGITVGSVQVTSTGVVGNASSASKLQNSVNVSLSGATTGSVSFDGSQSVTISTTLSNTGVASGTYTKVTVDGTGRVSNGANLSASDFSSALGYTPYSTNGGVIYGDATITGNFVVQGATTQVNATQTTLSDPIISLGSNTTSLVDGKDRGVEFKYGTGSSVNSGFFGYKSSTGRFTFLSSATNVNEVVSGSVGSIEANLVGNVTGDLTGNVTGKFTTARTITLGGNVVGSASFDGSQDITISASLSNSGVSAGSYGSPSLIATFSVDASGRITNASNVALNANSDNAFSTLVKRDSSGNFSATSITANLVGNADTATALKTPRNITLSGSLSGSATFDGSTDANITVTLANSGVAAGIFGSNTLIPVVTVDSSGRITNAQNVALNANSDNAPSTLVQRDASGNFAATSITANLVGNVTGNADTATTLKTSRKIIISGSLTGNASFDGSADANIAVTLANSGVTSGTYGSNTIVPVITVDASGRITNASNVSISFPLSNTANVANTLALRDANGDFAANAITANIVGNADTATALKTTRQIIVSGALTGNASFNGTADANIAVTLANSGVTAGSYGSNTVIPVISVDASGRITNASNIAVAFPLSNTANVPNTLALRDTNGNFAANTITANIVGNADTATALKTARQIIISGSLTGNATFNGTTDANIAVSLVNSGVTAGSYGSNTVIPVITIDATGRITNASNISVAFPLSNSSNVPNTTALRDANGNFAANTITANLAGNADTATALKTSRQIIISGSLTGNTTFNGTTDANIVVTINNSGVNAGSYGSNTAIPVITVDASGRITNASNISVSFPVSNSSNVPNTLVYRDANGNFAANTITANVVGSASKLTNTVNVALSGDVSGSMLFDGSSNQTISTNLSTTGVSAGTYGNAAYTPVITVDAKGRVTSLSTVSASPSIPAATSSAVGGVKQGSGITVAGDGTVSLNTNIFANSLSLSNSPGGANTTVTIVGHGKVFNGNFANSPSNIGLYDRMAGVYGDGRFVYTASYQQNIAGTYYSYVEYTDDGLNFSSFFTPTIGGYPIDAAGATYVSGNFYFASGNNNYLYISRMDAANGNMTPNTINTGLVGFGYGARDLVYAGGKILAAGSSNAAYSTDGSTWNYMPNTISANGTYGMGRLVSVGVSGSYPNAFTPSVSTDGGTTWTSGTAFGSTYPNFGLKSSVAYGNGLFVLVYGAPAYVNWTTPPAYGPNAATNISYYSSDGLNWSSSTLPSSQLWSSVTYGAGYFVASAWGTSAYAYSKNGVNWTQGTLPISSQWSTVNYGKGKFVFAPTGNATSGYYQQTAVLTPEGLITLEAENSGSIDNVDIGINQPRGAVFTNVAVENNLVVGGSITGNITASSTSRLATARTINVAGDANGSTTFDGSANASISITLGNSGVTAGTYGNASYIPSITVDAKGRITSVTNTAIAANKVSLTGDATGTGTFDSTGNAAVSVTFSNSGVASGTYGNASYTPVITVDAKGRVTSISTIASLGSGGGGVSTNTTTNTTNYRTTANFVANAGQTSFTFANYTINSIDVFRNGVRLDGSQGEYTATDGNTVVLTVAARANDSIVINSYNPPIANVSLSVGYATTSNAGLVQIGQNLSIAGLGQLSVPNATSSVAGVIKGGSDLSIDGNAVANLATTSVTAGTYSHPTLTVDSKGRVTSASNGTLVTSVAIANTAGLVVTGSPITSNGTINIGLTNTAVTPGTYSIPTFTVDAQGRITNAANGSALTISAYNTTVIASVFETVNITNTVLSTTATIPFTSGGIYYTTGNPSANFGFNFTGSGTTLNAQLANNQSLTMTILVTSGATAYIPTTFQVDGNAVTVKWLGGVSPASGNANSIDAYTFTIIKTASATFTVLASQSKYA
jgi:hypothetical protein